MRTLIDFDDAPVFAVPTADGPRMGLLVDGPQGWGEFSPPPDADDALAARWLTAAMEPSTVGWPDAVRGRVPVSDGRNRMVVTVGNEGAVDAAVAQIRRAADLEIVRLVCDSPAAAAEIRRRVDVPVAVEADLLGVDPQCADVAVLRCGALGGVRRAMRRVERLGVPALVEFSGATSIGAAGDVALAAALPDLPYACGPSPAWLRERRRLPGASLIPADGYLPAAPMPAAPDPARLERLLVTDAAVTRRWRDLVRRATALI
ncbi:O-succinylbenzoate-CoA synthase [Mycobacterium rufum]|uniref:O-succinylbenzoate-CoA synthase n=1 Tax=Mycolicibacterium rufum TaxID=318424 RepID=A0A9X3BR41_9MYCO|nr:O-succinylbenzoate-CoA synthase [Mycolicibacterium rufum]